MESSLPSFAETLAVQGLGELRAEKITTLQVNVGKLCNQACKHCHVDAGPHRTEIMTRETIEQALAVVRRFHVPVVDITGGAPELNPHFDRLVTGAREAGAHVIVRHNLTVQLTPGKENLPAFFRANDVEIIASLPYFLAEQTDAQRGRGVFEQSIEALRRLNALGYGQEGSGLLLHLVTNPVGAFLPPNQASIERDFKREMEARYGVEFNHLYTITNMPIHRFLDYLHRSGNYERYMEKLVHSFNPATVPGLMCRTLISVGWDGRLYDCDFNQMLELPLTDGMPQTIADLDLDRLAYRRIATGRHCFGCTAGAGSSCGGAVTK
ncbi:MAG TPA: arsenosugar biosynthesis radical SAM (seleno)protein ArsS [Chthonomonadaceae bacterium]|nr:arsenosugar biosynthesis radical SAM (seleno)protein ArsS [Chthonomonadaceae bacterium]